MHGGRAAIHAQVSAAEMLYGLQLRFSFTRNDLTSALDGLAR